MVDFLEYAASFVGDRRFDSLLWQRSKLSFTNKFKIAIALFDVRGPPLAVGRMAVDADKIDHGVTKGKAAVIVFHAWKDHLWTIGSKGKIPMSRL
jgi:hypothetical protein